MQLGPDQEGGNATLVLVVGGHGLVAAPDAENEISKVFKIVTRYALKDVIYCHLKSYYLVESRNPLKFH